MMHPVSALLAVLFSLVVLMPQHEITPPEGGKRIPIVQFNAYSYPEGHK